MPFTVWGWDVTGAGGGFQCGEKKRRREYAVTLRNEDRQSDRKNTEELGYTKGTTNSNSLPKRHNSLGSLLQTPGLKRWGQ